MEMKDFSNDLSDYEFTVPKELIAQRPLEYRDGSRLLVLDRKTGSVSHNFFRDICGIFNGGDCLVLNRTRVIPARVFGKKETGGKAELLFIEPKAQMMIGKHLAMVRPFIGAGKKIFFDNGSFARILRILPGGEAVTELVGITLENLIEQYGIMPLPPYIKRVKDDSMKELDMTRYQTVFAQEKGSIAAPTAGLHFTKSLLAEIKKKGVKIAEIVLHVGRGTFKLIGSQDISKHTMIPEYFDISEEASKIINETKKQGRRVLGCGTTTIRALESCAKESDGTPVVEPQKGFTDIFIYPGYSFKIVDSMFTNLHLPKSTPLMMVCAFAGKEKIFEAYEEAVKMKYRFFSYGDAMLII